MMEHTAIYECGERNWSAYAPDIPGCIASGMRRDNSRRREMLGDHGEDQERTSRV